MSGAWRGWVVPLALLAAAEIAMIGVDSASMAAPSDIVVSAWDALADGTVLRATRQTLGAALGGLLMGGLTGLILGLWLGLSRSAARLAMVSVELLRPVPSVALIPLSMMIFSFGYRMEIAVVAFTCFFPMLLLSQAAAAGIQPRLVEVAHLLGLSRLDTIRKIALPAAMPRVFVAFRLSAGVALVVAVTVEIAANPYGLGHGMMSAQQSLRPELMFALLLCIGTLGWVLNALLRAAEGRVFRHMRIEAA